MRDLENKMPPQRARATAAAIQGYRDHNELSKLVLEPLIDDNKILIFDRFYYDELVFKYIYGCPAFLLDLIYHKERDADLGFIVKISSDECIKRNQFRPDSSVAIYQSRESIVSLSNRFDFIAEKYKLIVLDGSQPRDALAKFVLDRISTFQKNDKEHKKDN